MKDSLAWSEHYTVGIGMASKGPSAISISAQPLGHCPASPRQSRLCSVESIAESAGPAPSARNSHCSGAETTIWSALTPGSSTVAESSRHDAKPAGRERTSTQHSVAEQSMSMKPQSEPQTPAPQEQRDRAAAKLQQFFKVKAAMQVQSQRRTLYKAMKEERSEEVLRLLLRGTAMPGPASDRERMLTLIANLEYAQLGLQMAKAFHDQGITAVADILALAGAAQREVRRQRKYQQHLVDVMDGLAVRLQLAAGAVLLSIDAVLLRRRKPESTKQSSGKAACAPPTGSPGSRWAPLPLSLPPPCPLSSPRDLIAISSQLIAACFRRITALAACTAGPRGGTSRPWATSRRLPPARPTRVPSRAWAAPQAAAHTARPKTSAPDRVASRATRPEALPAPPSRCFEVPIARDCLLMDPDGP